MKDFEERNKDFQKLDSENRKVVDSENLDLISDDIDTEN